MYVAFSQNWQFIFSIIFPCLQYSLFSFAGVLLILDLNIDEDYNLKILLTIVGLVLACVRLCIIIVKNLTTFVFMGLPSVPRLLLVFTAALNVVNLVFVVVGIPVVLV